MWSVTRWGRASRVLAAATAVAWVLAGAATAAPQAGAGAPSTPPSAGAGSPQAAPPAAAKPAVAPMAAPQEAGYTYRPEGRRDPFVSLVRGPGGGPDSTAQRSEGLAGVTVAELTLKGILYSRGAYIALVQGPDTKTYIARQNDRLADGTIRAIMADSLVILQEVNDPLSLTKQREVPKTLRALEGAK